MPRCGRRACSRTRTRWGRRRSTASPIAASAPRTVASARRRYRRRRVPSERRAFQSVTGPPSTSATPAAIVDEPRVVGARGAAFEHVVGAGEADPDCETSDGHRRGGAAGGRQARIDRRDERQDCNGDEPTREVFTRRGAGPRLQEVVVEHVQGDDTDRKADESGLAADDAHDPRHRRPRRTSVCPPGMYDRLDHDVPFWLVWVG